MNGTTLAILRQIESLGYVVVASAHGGAVEMRAGKADGAEPEQIVRCNDGDGEEAVYRAACLLAEAVGIDLEDG